MAAIMHLTSSRSAIARFALHPTHHTGVSRAVHIFKRSLSAQERKTNQSDPENANYLTKVELPLFIVRSWEDERKRQLEERKLQDEERKCWESERRDIRKLQDEERKRWESDRRLWDKERRQLQLEERDKAIQIVEMKKDTLHILDEKIKFEQKFNIRGGLERICYQAVLERKIDPVVGVQRGLDKLATTSEFDAVYNQEIARKKLNKPDVEKYRKDIYHRVSKHAHVNEETIKLRSEDFNPNEFVAVLSYYKMQGLWTNPLDWEEVDGEHLDPV